MFVGTVCLLYVSQWSIILRTFESHGLEHVQPQYDKQYPRMQLFKLHENNLDHWALTLQQFFHNSLPY